jgi:hypothetical protein
MRERHIGSSQCLDTVEKTRPRNAQLHAVRVVAITTGNWVVNQRARYGVRHRRDDLEAFHDLFRAMGFIIWDTSFDPFLLIRWDNGRMAMQTGARLFDHFDAFGNILIREHVGMAPLFAIVHPKGIASKDCKPNGIFVQLLKGFTATMARAHRVHRTQIAIILARIILPPLGGINCLLAKFDHAKNILLGFFFAFVDILQQKHDASREQSDDQNCCPVEQDYITLHDYSPLVSVTYAYMIYSYVTYAMFTIRGYPQLIGSCSLSWSMSNTSMAFNTINHLLLVARMSGNFTYQIGMAPNTIFL